MVLHRIPGWPVFFKSVYTAICLLCEAFSWLPSRFFLLGAFSRSHILEEMSASWWLLVTSPCTPQAQSQHPAPWLSVSPKMPHRSGPVVVLVGFGGGGGFLFSIVLKCSHLASEV